MQQGIIGYNFKLEKTDGLGINCDDLPVQHFRDGHSCGLPLAARIIGIVDRNHRVGFVHNLQVFMSFNQLPTCSSSSNTSPELVHPAAR